MPRQKSAAGTHLALVNATGQNIWFPARRCCCPDLRPAGPFGVALPLLTPSVGHLLACWQAPRVRGSRPGILSTVIGCAAPAPMPPLAAPSHAAWVCLPVLAPRPPLGCAARRSRGARPAAPGRQAGLRIPTDPLERHTKCHVRVGMPHHDETNATQPQLPDRPPLHLAHSIGSKHRSGHT